MIYIEKVKFKARPYAPKPEECTYWIDLTADPDGKVWKVWTGDDWELMNMGGGSGGSIDAYTKTESDRKFATNTALQLVSDTVTTKLDTLVSNVNIKTINKQSVLGSGDIEIAVGLDLDAVETLIEQRLDELVDGAPAAVDTLKELANAINNDPSFATTITNLLSLKLDTATYNSDKANYATKTEIADFITETEADTKYALKSEIGPGEEVDLSGYLTIESASSTYATKSELTSGLAIKLEEDDLDDYVTTDSLTSQLANKLDITTALSTYATKSEIAGKQDALISGETIKTVNGQSIMGSGNILIEAPEGGLTDAPADGNYYGRKDNAWSLITIPDTSNLATKTEVLAKLDTLVSGTNIKTINSQSLLGEGNIEITSGTGGITDAPSDSKTYGRNNGAWVEVTTPDLSSYASLTYVDNKVSELVNSAPEALDTLNELAAALGNDANFSTTITTALGNKVDSSIYNADKATFALKTELSSKQDTLVSGTNIKTINGLTLLGNGNITITGGGDIDLSDYVTTATLNNYALKSELEGKADLAGDEFTGTVAVPSLALMHNDLGMMFQIQSSLRETTFRTYNAGLATVNFLILNSTPLKLTEAGIWENGTLLENKYALLTEIPTNVSSLTNDANYITSSNLTLSSSYAASTATAPAANDTYEAAIAKLHAYVSDLVLSYMTLQSKVTALEDALTRETIDDNHQLG